MPLGPAISLQPLPRAPADFGIFGIFGITDRTNGAKGVGGIAYQISRERKALGSKNSGSKAVRRAERR